MTVRNETILALYVAHRDQLVDYASKILDDRAHAEDVVQEAYLRLDAAAATRLLGEPLRYLYRIVRNLALDTRRGLQRDRKRLVTGRRHRGCRHPRRPPLARSHRRRAG